MSNRRRYNEEQQAEMVKAYGGGMTLNDVAGMFGCSPMTVSAYVRQWRWQSQAKVKGAAFAPADLGNHERLERGHESKRDMREA